MKRSQIAAVIVAASIGCTFGAWAIAPSQDAEDPTVEGHANQAHQKSTVTPSSDAPGHTTQSTSNENKPSEHPPSAIMDRAIPAEKSVEETGVGGKHPPSRVMDRAVPEQKAPAASNVQSPNTEH